VAVGFVSSQGGEATTGQIAKWCRPEIVYVGGKPTAIQIVTHARALRSIGAKRDPAGGAAMGVAIGRQLGQVAMRLQSRVSSRRRALRSIGARVVRQAALGFGSLKSPTPRANGVRINPAKSVLAEPTKSGISNHLRAGTHKTRVGSILIRFRAAQP
jgi:hypothetical protein